MRLICPNCDAEYEVDDAAIPREGRDVQCSACGHAWFQEHPEVEAAREAEAALYEPPEGAVASGPAPAAAAEEAAAPAAAAPAPEAAPAPAAAPVAAAMPEEDEDEAPPAVPVAPAAPAAPPRARSLDEAVLSVLREEAEREQAARRAEAAAQPVLESQTEMPLAQNAATSGMSAAVRRIAEMRGLAKTADLAPEPAAPMPAMDASVDASETAEAPAGRGRKGAHVFPAIEEINSTLRAASDRVQDAGDVVAGTMPETAARRGGFRRGFVLLVSLAVIIVALYMLAPVLAARVPALEGAARAYVAAVDAARIWLDGSLRGLVEMLNGLAGDQQG